MRNRIRKRDSTKIGASNNNNMIEEKPKSCFGAFGNSQTARYTKFINRNTVTLFNDSNVAVQLNAGKSHAGLFT